MSGTPDPAARRSRAWVMVALLLLTLLLTAVLAYEALDAARSHRWAAENALRDYAAFAAWQYGRRAETVVYNSLHEPLHRIAHVNWEPGPMPVPLNDGSSPCACSHCDVRPTTFFRLDLATVSANGGRLRFTGQVPPTAIRAWLSDTVPAHVRPMKESGRPLGFIIDAADGRFHMIVYDRGSANPSVVYGYVAAAAELETVLRHVAHDAVLLPPSLLSRAPDSLFSIRVSMEDRKIFQSGIRFPEGYAATDTLSPVYGGLVARVMVNRKAADALLIGGLPDSKLTLLLGLLVLVIGLVFVALHQLRRQYELARMRRDFVSGVSHELRTPLAQVRMFSETLVLGRIRSESERRRAIEIINQEATRLTHLVGNVLRFSRAERGASQIDPRPVELAPEIHDIITSFRPIADSRGMELRAKLDERLAAPADCDAFRQMLLNLLDNAVKYGPAGQTIIVGLAHVDAAAHIRVVDEGPGIPPEQRERIFAAYHRLERDAESAIGGSGIGLSVVRELAELHGGTVRVDEAPGGGAVFTITLPDARRFAGAASGPRRIPEEVDAVA